MVKSCAGLRTQSGADSEYLWIASLAGLKGFVQQRLCGSVGWSLADCGSGGAEEIPWPAELRLHGPMGWGLTCSAGYAFSISWCGEAFHKLGVQSAAPSFFSAFYYERVLNFV
jgi:hypothetical protein